MCITSWKERGRLRQSLLYELVVMSDSDKDVKAEFNIAKNNYYL